MSAPADRPEDLLQIAGDRDPPDGPYSYHHNDTHTKRFWEHHDRESYTCPGCGTDAGTYHVHHIDGNEGNGSLANLTALCPDCHRQDHHQQRFDQPAVAGWKNAFRAEVMKEG